MYVAKIGLHGRPYQLFILGAVMLRSKLIIRLMAKNNKSIIEENVDKSIL